MDYEIIPAGYRGFKHPTVRIEGVLYPLSVKGGVVIEGRQAAQIASGDYGPLPQAYMRACTETGYPARFGWRGIVNALEDFAEVLLPNPIPADPSLSRPPRE